MGHEEVETAYLASEAMVRSLHAGRSSFKFGTINTKDNAINVFYHKERVDFEFNLMENMGHARNWFAK